MRVALYVSADLLRGVESVGVGVMVAVVVAAVAGCGKKWAEGRKPKADKAPERPAPPMPTEDATEGKMASDETV